MKDKYDTRTGMFEVKKKATNHEFKKWGYSIVAYWMSFDGNNGFHDATGRSAFGGEIYKENGSHGCVNLPLEKAKEVYENVVARDVEKNIKGTTVYVSAT